MTLTQQLSAILDRLDAEESADTYEIVEILKLLVSNIELSHARIDQEIDKLQKRLDALESAQQK